MEIVAALEPFSVIVMAERLVEVGAAEEVAAGAAD